MAKKEKTPSYVLTLQLKTSLYDETILNKRLEIGRKIYNAVLGEALTRYNTMRERKVYRKLYNKLKAVNKKFYNCKNDNKKAVIDKERKRLYREMNKLYEPFGLTEYSLINYVQPMYKHFKTNIDSKTGQALASRVWSVISKLLKGTAKKVHFKRYGEFNSLEGRWNKSGIKYDYSSNILWNGLRMSVIIKANDKYAQNAIQDRVKYVRIKKVLIRGKYKYYAQLILEGRPPEKPNRHIGIGSVGLDIGTQTIAVSSSKKVKLLELCPAVENIEKEKRKLQRKLDRQKRANNPDNFNKDGTVKKGIKLKWVKSKRYIKTQNKLREVYRRQAAVMKQSHEELSNYIISLGDRILVETMNYKALQARAKKTTKNKKGKFNCKKRFGKSLANKAPSMLLSILNRKLKYYGKSLLEINTKKVKASQYNHFTGKYKKKKLSQRWNYFNVNDKVIKIQRDLYSSFLIMNVNDDLETINQELCQSTFGNFKELHDVEMQRLTVSSSKKLSSYGI